MQFVIFKLSNEYFAVETDKVVSISDAMVVTKVPKSPEYVKGLINLRGTIKPLVNLNMLLNIDACETQENIIIINVDGEEIGVPVDQVVEVLEIDKNKLQKLNNNTKEYIEGVIKLNENLITIINISKILKI